MLFVVFFVRLFFVKVTKQLLSNCNKDTKGIQRSSTSQFFIKKKRYRLLIVSDKNKRKLVQHSLELV